MKRFKENITKPAGPGLPKPENKVRRSVIWMGLLAIVLLIDRFIPTAVADQFYYRGLFSGLRPVYDYVFGYSPIPMIYLVAGAIVVRIIYWIGERKRGFSYMAIRALGGVSALVFFFYVFWAFNYHQVSLPKHLGYDLKSVTAADIKAEFDRASASLKMAADSLPPSMTDDFSLRKKAVSDNDIRDDVEAALKTLGLPHLGRVRVRQLWPKGTLLRWSTAGIYIPQVGEGHIDEGLLSVQKPFTMAHEMAHGYGVTDEGACNFIAWLACERSVNPWMRFSGALTYWKYVAYDMPSDTVQQMLKTFPEVVERSMKLIRENDKKYPDLFPRYRDAIYTSYLKHHGIKEGLMSYNEVVLMVQQYVKRNSLGTDSK
jgi:hypothetical protein